MRIKPQTSVLESRYQEFLQTVIATRARDLDDLIGQISMANGEGRLTDAEAQQLDDAARARRAVLANRQREAARVRQLAWTAQHYPKAMRPLVQVHHEAEAQRAAERARAAERQRAAERRAFICRNRPKTFEWGRPKPMSGHDKANLMRRARELMTRTEPGKHYGVLTDKFVKVLEKLLYTFHNAITGLCFPSYDSIAEAADCSRSTVYNALAALETAELLSWDHRLKRKFETVVNLFGALVRGQRSTVERTSNSYTFFFEKSSKSKNIAGTTNQEKKKDNSFTNPVPTPVPPVPDLEKARLDASRKWLEERKADRR